jgi:hypothetical protein
MFKSGEIAGVRGQETRRVTILTSSDAGQVETSEGTFKESALFVAHPSVLATAAGRDLEAEAFWSRPKLTGEERKALVPADLLSQVEKVLAKATFQWNGHWKDGSFIMADFKANMLKRLYFGPSAMRREDVDDLLRASKAKRPLTRWVPMAIPDFRMALRVCSCCGETDFGLETNGEVIRIAGQPCRYPEGLPPTEWELNVPSGELVVANDLRTLFPLLEEDFDINTTWGCRQTTLAYAATGMAHAMVGNTCPSVYLCKDGSYKIANPPPGEQWDGKAWVKIKPKPKFDGKAVAEICTDLWWYSICDHEEFLRRCQRFGQKPADFSIKVVKIPAGVYRFRHDEHARGNEGDGECLYARFEKVRESDPVKEFLAVYEEAEVNAHAYVQAQAARWPTLFGQAKESRSGKEETIPWADLTEMDRLSSWRRVADHTMCVIGGGVDWHEKGFPQAKVDASVLDVEPPSFRAQHHWYPFSRPYGGLFEPKVLAPSFAKLAFRILESVISFGMTVNDSLHSREVIYVRERMLVAVKRYRELAKQYPDLADPEYVSWLSQKGRAEAWVEGFDLGPEFTSKHRDHALKQRWVPEDAYAVEFDARKLKDGHFAWHPKVRGGWANKKDAQRYALLQWEDNEQDPEHNCFWASNAVNTTVPLYCVVRVVKVGAVSHMGETLVEVSFDYGTPWMKDGTKRKALAESKEKDGIRVLTKEEYEQLLPKAIQFFEEAEKQF